MLITTPLWEARFRFDTQRVGNAIDVIKVGDDLHCVVNRGVGPADRAQRINVLMPANRGCSSHLFRVIQQRGNVGSKVTGPPVIDNLMNEVVKIRSGGTRIAELCHHAAPIVLDLRPEVRRMSLHSVMATVGFADHDSK